MYSIIFLTSRLFNVDVAFYDNQSCIKNTYIVKEDTDSQCMYMSFEDEKKPPKFTANAALIAKIYNKVYLILINNTCNFQLNYHY